MPKVLDENILESYRHLRQSAIRRKEKEKLVSETERVATKISKETPHFDSTSAIRQMREND